ncbi:unnamed protein product [marine sediment metagenome]|uniref:Uncharacterized protein n=1 Tax=marine sediment metagenome TaxID=412755 RepID=X1QLN2_9ZZZZ
MGFGSGGAATFIELKDTPAAYTGQADKLVKVKAGEDGLDLVMPYAGIELLRFYNGEMPTDIAWAYESPIPFTLNLKVYFSPIFKTEGGEYYVYVVGQDKKFYLYNITRARWTRLADTIYDGGSGSPSSSSSRALAVSPDGTKLACCSEITPTTDGGRRLEIYNRGTGIWSASSQCPNICGVQIAYLQSLVWVDDDTIWAWARESSMAANEGQCVKYVVSTDTWTVFAAETGVKTYFQGYNCAMNADGTVIFGGNIGASQVSYCKYTIATDSYAYGSLPAGRYCVKTADRFNLWYIVLADNRQAYLECQDESQHENIFPENTERDGTRDSFGVFGEYFCLCYARDTAPRLMSYYGTGMYHLITKVFTSYNMMVFNKPDDGFAIDAVEETLGFHIPVFNYDTLTLPAGTWKFYYPKDGDYSQVQLWAGKVGT